MAYARHTFELSLLWNAVLTYIQLFEDIFKYLKISSNELKISSNHLKISSIHLKISLNDLKISSNHLKISSNELKISSNGTICRYL